MDLKKAILATAGVGAGLMYLFDPEAGRRRRALLRDKMTRGVHVSKGAVGVTSRDMKNRATGLLAEFKNLFSREEVSSEVLTERVRSQLGGAVSHPGSVEVDAQDGRVVLTGVVLANELNNLIRQVRAVRGVKEIENHLETHEEPGNVPGLQGGQSRRRLAGRRFELMQSNWSPAARFLTGLAGGALAIGGLRYRGVAGTAGFLSGVTLLTRAVTNMELKRLFGIGAGTRAVDIQKAIHVNAPVDTVYGALSQFENFPSFMTNIQRVTKLDGNRYRWRVTGPGDIPVEWDSVLTSAIRNHELAWRTEPGSPVQHAGVMKFISNPDGSTTVDVRLTYNPVAGGVGHVLASLLGVDPKTKLNEDLSRMKTYLESGKEPRDAAAPRH
ncbi:MAG: BON domain-containing protein [Desulfobacteraceae bacterium]|nr:MAG: BON domain-containing protein [Desulfobacteraceae bacterium]